MRLYPISILAFVLLAADLSEATAPAETFDAGAATLIPVARDVYAVSPNFAGANGAVILSDTGHIVVDSHGSPASARALIDAVATLSDVPIRYVINTHWHVDHHVGNSAYRSAYGQDVVLISHEQTRRDIPTLGAEQFALVADYRANPVAAADSALDSGVDSEGERLDEKQIEAVNAFRDEQQRFVDRATYDYLLADLTYDRSITLHGNERRVDVFFLYPAHTESDSIVYVPDAEILIVGDLLTQPILWSWSSYPAAYVKTLLELEELPVKKILIGHGGPVLEGKAYLTQVRRFLQAIVAHVDHAESADAEALSAAAAGDPDIEGFRRQFVDSADDAMFDQMVAWTIERALLEKH